MNKKIFLGTVIVVIVIAVFGVLEFIGFTPITASEESAADDRIVVSKVPEYYAEEFGTWASKVNTMLSEPFDDPRLKEAKYDIGFEYYLKAQEALKEFPYPLIPLGDDIHNDYNNLVLLSGYINHYQFARTGHLGPNGEAKEATELADQWKPADANMHQAFKFLKQMVNDLDIAFNHKGEGKVFGVTYLLSGEKVSQIDELMKGNYSEAN